MNEFIEIRGARENNLKDVSLRIPKRKITIFTGVSGSGKSSIVFDTIATEAQRQLYENFSLFIRNFLPRYPPPDADAIENLSMAVIVDQKRLGGGSHSTVGTITDIYTLLRLLFSRVGKPHVGYSNAFSFNDPAGHVPRVQRPRQEARRRRGRLPRPARSRSTRARCRCRSSRRGRAGATPPRASSTSDKKLSKFTREEMDLLLHSKPRKVKMRFGDSTMNVTFMGIIEKIERAYIKRDLKTLSRAHAEGGRALPAAAAVPAVQGRAAQPGGARLQDRRPQHRRAVGDGDRRAAAGRPGDRPTRSPRRSSPTLVERLQHVVDIGLDYLTLNRETDTLSGGESQRVKMVKHLGSSLVDVMYIFDEPSVGLHPRDVHRLNELLQKLRDKGNTVIVVEHDPDVIKIADHVVDVGPHAGTRRRTSRLRGQLRRARSTPTR